MKLFIIKLNINVQNIFFDFQKGVSSEYVYFTKQNKNYKALVT